MLSLKNAAFKLSSNLNVDITELYADFDRASKDVDMGDYEARELFCQTSVYKTFKNPDYGLLAGRVACDYLHNNTFGKFSDAFGSLVSHKFVVDTRLIKFVKDNKTIIDNAIVKSRDFEFDYFAFKTLERSYLMRINDRIVETPQYMFMRVAIGIHGYYNDIDNVLHTYELLSTKKLSHATPTLFNSATRNNSLASCFLVTVKEDSIDGIFDTVKDVAKISKSCGGIGLNLTKIRATGTKIGSTGGQSQGIINLLKLFNDLSRYIDQGGRRRGSICCFVKDTEVFTVNDGVKKIQDIKLGDLVVTHQNRIKPVYQIHHNPLGDRKIYKLEVEKSKPIYVTGNHRFMTENGWKAVDALDVDSDYIKKSSLSENTFLKVRSITETDRTDEVVYTFGVEDDHSYTVEGLIAENCSFEPWHKDIGYLIDLRKNVGADEFRARDLFTAIWMCDLFMERVESDSHWTLMCPHECPGLDDVYGDDFKKLYEHYENTCKTTQRIRARDLWVRILEAQAESGTPYILYKDACNRKSNQKHLGTIKCSNLCAEIVEYSSPNEIAVCTLASICLPNVVDDENVFESTVRQAVRNLNRTIDVAKYPVKECSNSHLKNRPIGIGVQGLADVFASKMIPFESPEAKELNKRIFEKIYYWALDESMEIAKVTGPHNRFHESPAAHGILQFDMWDGVTDTTLDWDSLKERIKTHGLANSLVTALMPTASTAQIFGNSESFEPYTTNVFTRRVLSGEFPVINRHLVYQLSKLGIWNDDTKNKIIADNGSIQNIDSIPDTIKSVFKTIWEIKQRTLIDMAADRGRYIDQSQSMNLYVEAPTTSKLSAMHLYSWKAGVKTGMYYLRSRAAADPVKVTVDANASCAWKKGRKSADPDCTSCTA